MFSKTLVKANLACNSKALLGLSFLSIALTGCSGGGSSAPAAVEEPVRAAGMLSRAASAEVLETSIKRGLKQAFDASNTPLAATEVFLAESTAALAEADAGAAASTNFTTTYTIEDGVGEADIVKYDGELLYAVQRPRYCPECADGQGELVPRTTQVLISRTDPQNASAETVGSIDLRDDLNVEGMYLPESGQLVVLQSSAFYGICGVGWSLPWYWENQKTRVSFFDTSNPAEPTEVTVLELDGAFTASRRVDGNLYLVSRFTPSNPGLPIYYSAEGEALDDAAQAVDAIALTDLLPTLSRDGETENLLEATDCYTPTDTDIAPESASLTTISVIPFSNPANIQSSCYTGEAYGMYMSTEALYLTSQRYEYSADSSADYSVLHKFALDGQTVSYRGSAEVPGTLGHGEQLDFRISEHNDLLRVVTSEYNYSQTPVDIFITDEADAGADSIDHRVTVLRESSSEVALEVVSTLPNESRPAEIGKPDERLYGVRFFGDRAYMVTFQQIDPLYIIDLSDPEDPLIAGELEVPGVADFLHPVSENLLLTVGRNATVNEPSGQAFFGGLKLELFDVSDISLPQSISRINIGDRGTYSEALYDRHAFSYQANFRGEGSNARFALPVDLYLENTDEPVNFWNQQWIHSGLYSYEIANPADARSAALLSAGELITEAAGEQRNYPRSRGERRSVLHDESIFFINNGEVTAAAWSDAGS